MRPKILYVDDEPLNLQLFEINFRKNYEVHIAESGKSGIEVLDSNPEIFIILSDMKMPQMNGLEFIKKAKEKYPDKKFSILTGFGMSEEIIAALDSGLIFEYFSKPFNIREIDRVLREIITNS
jgi:response regulator RpfG family c-di-GMP phosphodiesterase